MNETSKPELLIIYDYHPKEVFATKVGRHLENNGLSSVAQVIKYGAKPDRKKSSYCLRKFAVSFNPPISPVVLHGDDNHFDAAIIYRGRSKEMTRRAQRPLMNFCFDQYEENGLLVCYGRFADINPKCSIIDIELNEKMGLEAATELVERFSRYLLDLRRNKNITL
jgi:hypothetical protein